MLNSKVVRVPHFDCHACRVGDSDFECRYYHELRRPLRNRSRACIVFTVYENIIRIIGRRDP